MKVGFDMSSLILPLLVEFVILYRSLGCGCVTKNTLFPFNTINKKTNLSPTKDSQNVIGLLAFTILMGATQQVGI